MLRMWEIFRIQIETLTFSIAGIAGFEPRENRPQLKEWIEKVRSECNPHYDEAHVIVDKMAEKTKQAVQAKLWLNRFHSTLFLFFFWLFFIKSLLNYQTF